MKQRPLWKIFPGHLLLTLLGTAWLAAAPAAHAAGPVAGSVPYQTTGKVDDVNSNQNQIVIDDRAYVLADNVTILSGNRATSKGALKKGMNLGFNSTADRNRSVITEIWILPVR